MGYLVIMAYKQEYYIQELTDVLLLINLYFKFSAKSG